MGSVRIAIFLVVAVFFAAGCQGPKIAKKGCVDCHAKEYGVYSEGRLHRPVAEKKCEGCHIPHGLLGALKLKKQDPWLCYDCHEKDKDLLKKSFVHAPVKEGKCLECHNPHAADREKLLANLRAFGERYTKLLPGENDVQTS